VVAPVLHKYEYGAVPPLMFAVAVPLLAPLHVTFVTLTVTDKLALLLKENSKNKLAIIHVSFREEIFIDSKF
jgi:hypothetical protein